MLPPDMRGSSFYGIFLVIIFAASLALRWPTLNQGKPFFYEEDEAHHFNRVVEMVKRGSLDPQYFHKPSLHFYLRMPMVIVGYFAEPAHHPGETIQEIKTRDSYGLARYAFTWSHPRVVLAVRSVSLLLTMLTLLLVVALTRQVGMSRGASLATAIIYSVSPELFHYSSFIGVDVPLMFFCCLTTVLALAFKDYLSSRHLWIIGISAGLAVSCKYNGAPIALLPLLLVMVGKERRSGTNIGVAIAAPLVGFLVGSPYILFSFHTFYQQLSYEVWHYAVAGHEGHMAEPGLAQLLHYGRWLASDGIGVVGLCFAVIGLIQLARKKPTHALVFSLFPLLFFSLMCAQRTNFVRNMVPIIPFVAITAVYPVYVFVERYFDRTVQPVLYLMLIACISYAPLSRTLELRNTACATCDTRNQLEEWANTEHGEIALSGELQPHRALRELPHVTIISGTESSDSLFQKGFDTVALPAWQNLTPGLLAASEEFKSIPGIESEQRIVESPAIHLYRLSAQLQTPSTINFPRIAIPIDQPLGVEPEPYLWISNRLTRLELPSPASKKLKLKLQLTIMSPWKDQQFELIGNGWQQNVLLNQQNPGEWKATVIEVPRSAYFSDSTVLLRIATIARPAARGLNTDERRLGLAIKTASFIE